MNPKQEMQNSKVIFGSIVGVALLLIVIMVIYSKSDVLESSNKLPDGQLSENKGKTTYEVNTEKYPFIYNFQDIPYGIAVPAKGIARVEGGYAYSAGSYGLVVSEVSTSRTLQAYSSDVYASIYATKESASLSELLQEEGYINGYKALYAIYSVQLKDISKNLFQIAYLIELDEQENIIVLASMDNREDLLVGARDLLVEMLGSLAVMDTSSDIPSDDNQQSEQPANEDGIVTREAQVEAEYDYETLYLTFSYMDIKSKPQECKAFDKNGVEYPSVDEKPGSISFKIPNVKEGDIIKLIVTSGDLKGATVDQMEYADYLKSVSDSEVGVLHVEESEVTTTEESNEATE